MTEYTCFECGSTKDIHHHHVVPRILGGTKTIPLCATCHGLAHGINYAKHSRLTKAGMAKRKEQNLCCGKVPYGFSVDENKKLFKNPDEAEIMLDVDRYRAEKVPWRVIVLVLNKGKRFNRSGREWSISNLYQIHKRWDDEYRKRYLSL